MYNDSYIPFSQINAELAFHNIDLYPYDNTEDYDDEERMLNSSIRVSFNHNDKLVQYIYNLLLGSSSLCCCWIRKASCCQWKGSDWT